MFIKKNQNKHNISLGRPGSTIATKTTILKIKTANIKDQLTAMFCSEAAYALTLCMVRLCPP